MKNTIDIRKATVNDVVQLQQISRQTFVEAYSALNTVENLNKYLEEDFSVEKLTGELHNGESEFYFALQGQQVIAYLKLNKGLSQTELRDEEALEIERIYVLQEYQGMKIGQLLYEKALQVSKDSKASYLWLGVWEENTNAIGFYKKNGFVPFDQHIFKFGDDEQTDIMMKKTI
ncbi:GNAT family N-acetyltransferase [Pedobacter sp.]|uniref:GNAT family N-acetyltransferase n=1 Tax=Pedobacter sp. TaxID=1411316 RepID=UPI003D7F8A63